MNDDPAAIAFWRARRAELLQVASEHAERAALLYSALYVTSGVLV